MSAKAILARVRAAGLDLKVKKNKLRYEWKKDRVDPEVLNQLTLAIRGHKAEIIRLLTGIPKPRQCLRHASLRGCVAPLVETLRFGECICCKATIPPDATGQCTECEEDIRRVLGPGPDVDWSKDWTQ